MSHPIEPPRPRRSLLYVPAAEPRRLDKARRLPVDGVIVDLEDAVAPEIKITARRQARTAIAGGYGDREAIVRINALSTPWGADDLAAAVAAGADAIALPKVAGRGDLVAAAEALATDDPAGRVRLFALIETPAAILALADIAASGAATGGRLAGLVIGSNDLAKETGVRGRAPLVPWLMMAVAAARANGLAVIDGVYNDFSDEAGFAAECRAGRDMGFDGKTLIHPGQIAAANAAFAPDPRDVAEARAIVAAFDDPANAGRGVIALDGRMVERLHAHSARRLLALDAAIARRTSDRE